MTAKMLDIAAMKDMNRLAIAIWLPCPPAIAIIQKTKAHTQNVIIKTKATIMSGLFEEKIFRDPRLDSFLVTQDLGYVEPVTLANDPAFEELLSECKKVALEAESSSRVASRSFRLAVAAFIIAVLSLACAIFTALQPIIF